MTAKLPTIVVVNSARGGTMAAAVKQCVDLVNQGRLDLSYLVTHRMGMDGVQQAYDLYSQKTDGIIKAVMSIGT